MKCDGKTVWVIHLWSKVAICCCVLRCCQGVLERRVTWVHCKMTCCCSASSFRQLGKMWQQIQGGSGQLLSRMAGKVLERAKAPLQPHWDVSVHFSSLGFQKYDFKQTSRKWPLRNKRWFSLFLKGRLNSLSGITVLTEDREGWITIEQ